MIFAVLYRVESLLERGLRAWRDSPPPSRVLAAPAAALAALALVAALALDWAARQT